MSQIDAATAILAGRELSKSFGHVHALRGVSFAVEPGEVLAVVGDNGAGKSTLIKILSGVYDPDPGGVIEMRGQPTVFSSPSDATSAGVATVFQDLALIDSRDVTQNLFLGRELRGRWFVDRREMDRQAVDVLRRFTFRLPTVRVPVAMLSGGQRQAVAIARVLLHGAEVVILDEPTAALGVQESARVLDLVRNLREEGKAVILVSHNLQQVWDLVDRFLVLRLGAVAGTRRRDETTVDEVIKLIVYGSETTTEELP